jgi:predicted protein tyrosine phosphatase
MRVGRLHREREQGTQRYGIPHPIPVGLEALVCRDNRESEELPDIAIAPYTDVYSALASGQFSHVISILGNSDGLNWPETDSRQTVTLKFDDVGYSSGSLTAPSKQDIQKLIEFAREWNGLGHLLIHCRAGTSRSPAAAMIAVASVPKIWSRQNVECVLGAKAYYRPNSTMLRLADQLLHPCPGLLEVARSFKPIDRAEDVSSAVITLNQTQSPRLSLIKII